MQIQPVDHLIAAVLSVERGRIERLIAHDPALGRQRNMFGVSAVHAAHFSGRADLAAHGAGPDHVPLDGTTALHTADRPGHSRVGWERIGAGSDPASEARAGPLRREAAAESALLPGHLVLASELDRHRPR